MDTSADTRVDDRPTCPDCGSSNTTFKKKASEWECQDCEHRFPTPHAAGMGRIDLSQKTGDPKRIFFSYGHDGNRELVDRFKGDLEKRGHEVWIDYKEIGTWDDWRGQITAGIAQSQLAIAFLSKHATRDPGVCRNEVAMALDRFFTVYPILMEPLDQVSPPVTISHIQWQDLSRWRAILAGTVPEINWDRWYEARLIEIVDLVESQAGHFGGEIQVLENVLRPLSFTSEITRHIPSFTGRQWVFEAYKDWLENQPQSRLFWIQGGRVSVKRRSPPYLPTIIPPRSYPPGFAALTVSSGATRGAPYRRSPYNWPRACRIIARASYRRSRSPPQPPTVRKGPRART